MSFGKILKNRLAKYNVYRTLLHPPLTGFYSAVCLQHLALLSASPFCGKVSSSFQIWDNVCFGIACQRNHLRPANNEHERFIVLDSFPSFIFFRFVQF